MRAASGNTFQEHTCVGHRGTHRFRPHGRQEAPRTGDEVGRAVAQEKPENGATQRPVSAHICGTFFEWRWDPLDRLCRVEWTEDRLMRRTLGAAVGLVALAAMSWTAPVRAGDDPASTEKRVLRGMHQQVRFERDVSRTAVGDQKILSTEVLNSRTLLLLGRDIGRTSLLVWFSDDSLQTFDVTVQPDLDLLQRALHDIHAAITVEMAPDRPAVVLRGTVPDVLYSRSAEAAASAYLKSERSQSSPVVAAPSAAPGAEPGPTVQAQEPGKTDSAVINLIRVEKLPLVLEERIRAAVKGLGASEVTVDRLTRGDQADDTVDVILLKGRVQDQVMLTRVLHVASTMIGGSDVKQQDLRVLSDESGGIPGRTTGNGGSSGSGGSSGNSSFGSMSGGGSSNGDMINDIEANPARAKAVSLAAGRILSFIDVTDIPQVRLDVRIYEIDRSALFQYAPELTIVGSDFNQGSLRPPTEVVGIEGAEAVRAGGTTTQDVQGVVSFLTGGTTGELQYAGSHFAMDAVLSVLQTRGIARSLSNPSLTVLSGENASFQVGGEVPIPQSFSPAFGTTTTTPDGATPGVFNSIEFKPFGVDLQMRPLVGDDGRVTVNLFSEISEPDAVLTTLVRDTTGTDPATTAFQARTIETTARLKDGQALMIGGLIGRRSRDGATYTPWIERIPVIGWLFKRFTITDEDREIVIVVNPTVVRDPIPGLGIWRFPDVAPLSRRWVDKVLEFGQKEWPHAKSDGCVR
jgi:pilus assembly protein CpaC